MCLYVVESPVNTETRYPTKCPSHISPCKEERKQHGLNVIGLDYLASLPHLVIVFLGDIVNLFKSHLEIG